MPGLVMAMNVWYHHNPSAVSIPTLQIMEAKAQGS